MEVRLADGTSRTAAALHTAEGNGWRWVRDSDGNERLASPGEGPSLFPLDVRGAGGEDVLILGSA